MKKNHLIIITVILCMTFSRLAYAPWLWTPDGGWMNEKDLVKESPKAQLEHAQAQEEKGEYNNAARAYKSLIKAYPTSPLAAKAQENIANCYYSDNFLYKAFEAYQKLIENYPQEIDFDSILEKQYNIGILFITGKKRKLWRLPIVPAQDKGIEILQKVIDNAPFSQIAPKAQFKLALGYKRRKKYDKAIEAYKNVLKNYPESSFYEESLYQIGVCYYIESKGSSYDKLAAKEAITALTKFNSEFPESTHISKVKEYLENLEGRQSGGIYEIALFYEKNNHTKAAIKYYNNVIDSFPDTEEANKAKKRLEKLQKK